MEKIGAVGKGGMEVKVSGEILCVLAKFLSFQKSQRFSLDFCDFDGFPCFSDVLAAGAPRVLPDDPPLSPGSPPAL